MKSKIFLLNVLCIFTIELTHAQQQVKRTFETAYVSKSPVIDGQSSDSCWNLVDWQGEFIQIQPYENTAPTQQTYFKILYDNNNLYVLIHAADTEADKINKRISRRDNFDGDRVLIHIDSYYDQQTAFSFTSMASGSKGDEAITQDGNNWDDSWNPVWYMNTSIDDSGWYAEMRIPFSQLRFGKKEDQVWGIQVERYIHRSGERSMWQYIPKGSPGMVHLFGELHGMHNITPKRQIELVPYTVARLERFEKEEGNPFLTGKASNLSFGLDGKAAITNDLTLDFSLNPDFGQVEADPSEVNLSAFESYFSERRPLFVEGKNIYEFEPTNTIVISNMGADNMFYSRRIGRYPQYYPSVSDSEYVKMPDATTILGAVKLSGKTKNGLSIGILESLTANENAEIDNAGHRRKESVEPLTNYFVGRVQKDFKKGETVLGGIVTAVNRDIRNVSLDYLHTAGYTGGIDFKHLWKERTWYVAGNAEVSHVRGKQAAIVNTQRSSARYFQRPDASYVSVDSSKTSLEGIGGTVKFGRSSQKRLQFETSFTVRSPGLEFNDIGFMRRSDVIHHGTWVAYYLREPFLIFRNFYLNTNYWMYWNFSGKLTGTFLNTNFNSEFKNRWRINGNITRESENISTSLLRGGPSFIEPGSEEMNLNIRTDPSKKLSFFAGNYQGFGDVKSYRASAYWGGVNYKPTNGLSFSLEPEYISIDSKLQYVGTYSFQDDPRYLFAEMAQQTMTITLRLNYTINPELSLEYYGQPFVSAGKYSHLKMITDYTADTYSGRYREYSDAQILLNETDNTYHIDENLDYVTDYTVSNPDFNFRQFRSNFVLRWEYRPGSTLFLVWSQGRTNTVSDGRYAYGSDIRDLFSTTPHNVFLIKFSYWFSM